MPLDGFYEWKKTATGKQPYAIALKDRRLMGMAGLWETWRSPAGETVRETSLRYADFANADEIFSSGNFAKVAPIIRIDDRSLQPGPFYSRARKLYWDFAHG